MTADVLKGRVAGFQGLIRSIEGLRNARAVSLLVGTSIAALMLVLFGVITGSAGVMTLAVFLAVICVLVGVSAAGGVLMDQARGVPLRSLGEAFATGVVDLGKYIVIMLLAGVALLLYLLAMAIVLLICKIPFLGPLLYALLLAPMVIVSAVVALSLGSVLVIGWPAIWEGNTIRATSARFAAICLHRLPELVIGTSLLYLVLLVVAVIVWGILMSGVGLTGLMSGVVLGSDIGGRLAGIVASMMGGMMSGMGGGRYGGGGEGYAYAMMFGSGVLVALVLAANFAVGIMGSNMLYLQVCAGLDTVALEGELAQRLERAKQKAGEVQQRVRQRAEDVQARAHHAAVAPPLGAPADSATPAETSVCPSCSQPVGPADQFCGSCGAKLR